MLNSVAIGALLILGAIVLQQLRDGGPAQLSRWVKAKAFNSAEPAPPGKLIGTLGGPDRVAGTPLTPGGAAAPGSLAHPTPGAPAPTGGQRFGAPRSYGGHRGADFGIPIGTPVHAAAAGTVTHAGAGGGYGQLVKIAHPGNIETRYAHLRTGGIRVRVGEQVTAGQVIAESGNTGVSTGPHLHFEVRCGSAPKDPMARIGRPLAQVCN
jgi:murein DD-endopeptidase MepM/ murein hydrolase activator NlpD